MSQFLHKLPNAQVSGVRPAELVPQNGHVTANTAVPPWHLEGVRCLSAPHLAINQQVRLFQEPMAALAGALHYSSCGTRPAV